MAGVRDPRRYGSYIKAVKAESLARCRAVIVYCHKNYFRRRGVVGVLERAHRNSGCGSRSRAHTVISRANELAVISKNISLYGKAVVADKVSQPPVMKRVHVGADQARLYPARFLQCARHIGRIAGHFGLPVFLVRHLCVSERGQCSRIRRAVKMCADYSDVRSSRGVIHGGCRQVHTGGIVGFRHHDLCGKSGAGKRAVESLGVNGKLPG